MFINKKNWVEWILLGVIVVFVSAYVVAAFYAIPFDDDFSNGNVLKHYLLNDNYFISSLKSTLQIYKTWQGTYFGCFLTYFLSPFLRGGIVGVEIEYAVGIMLFFLTIGTLLYQLFMYIFNKIDLKIYLLMLIIIFIYGLLFTQVNEVFYWHTGMSVYLFPFICALFCFSITISYFRKKKISKIVIASILSFLAAGGALQVSAYICVILLGVCLFRFLLIKKIGKVKYIFGSAFLGALINVASPGNFARKKVIGNQYNIFEIIGSSIKTPLLALYKDFSDHLLIVVILSLLFIGMYILRKVSYEFKCPGLITVYALIGVVIVDFPVKLGYACASFPTRCVFIERMALTTCVICVTLYWAGWLTKKINLNFSKEFVICICLSIFILSLPFIKYDALKQTQPGNIYKNLCKGDLMSFREEGVELLSYLENTPEVDVVVEKSLDGLGIFSSLSINEDKSYWVNCAVAEYYGKNSVCLKD